MFVFSIAHALLPAVPWQDQLSIKLMLSLVILLPLAWFCTPYVSDANRKRAILLAPKLVLTLYMAELFSGFARGMVWNIILLMLLVIFGLGFSVLNVLQPVRANRNLGLLMSYIFVIFLPFILIFVYVAYIDDRHPFFLKLFFTLGVFLLIWTPIVRWLFRVSKQRQVQLGYCCAFCLHDLRGSPDAVSCPECGATVTHTIQR